MKKIILKELSKKMNFRYRILLTIFSDYSIFVFTEGTKVGFNWNVDFPTFPLFSHSRLK